MGCDDTSTELVVVPFAQLKPKLSARDRRREIVTQSSRIRKLIQRAKRIARSRAPVLISGESGTGKELFAQLIHDQSARHNAEFVKVNCAALHENLIESELFGHEKGSFTDAYESRVGRFEVADGGTLLLDEVTEIPGSTQAKLLRVLEEAEFERVGGNETIKTDFRIIASCNRNLQDEVAQGTFRLDLYHRLNVIELRIPPLKERLEDIPLLAMHFLSMFKDEAEVPVRGFNKQAMKKMSAHHWPGNIRELRNVVHRACLLTDNAIINAECIELVDDGSPETEKTIPDQWLQTRLADIEQQIILAAIEKFGNKRVVAEKLGVSPRTLTNKLRIYREAGICERAA